MDWERFLLGLIGLYSTYIIAVYAKRYLTLKYLSYAIASLFFTLGQLSYLLEPLLSSTGISINSGSILEWTSVISISFLLSGLAVLIRESKPVFAQFPLIYAAVPLFLIISYWLVLDTLAIKEWLISIYQGGALLVALLMYGVHYYRMERFIYLLVAVVLFLVTFIVYWFIPGFRNNGFLWVPQLLLGASILTAVYGLRYSLKGIDIDHSLSGT